MDQIPPAPFHAVTELSLADSEIISAIKQGDGAAFERLYLSYFTALWEFAYSYVRSQDTAQEIVQDVFFALWMRHLDWSVRTSIKGYLYSAVRNKALQTLEHDHVAKRFVEVVSSDAPLNQTQVSTDSLAEISDLERCIAKTIRALPERQRQAMMFRVVQDMNYAEIAVMLNVSIAAIGKLVDKAQRKIRKICLGG